MEYFGHNKRYNISELWKVVALLLLCRDDDDDGDETRLLMSTD